MVKKIKIELMSADFGRLNPFPDINNIEYIHAGFEVASYVTEEERLNMGKGMIDTLIPYMMQDGYNRKKTAKEFEAVEISNGKLKAVFMPQFGGRLFSLYDMEHNRDLLYTNTVMQPANFALRNAWLSGGVEFNIGIKGHSPLTCSPLFCDISENENAIRMYGYERIRGVAYSVTAYLPEDSDVLYIRPRIENSQNNEIRMYWWSNIAFPETQKARVIVPTDEAFACLYREGHYTIGKTTVPFTSVGSADCDISYPFNVPYSADYFYKIPKADEKWIAAVDENGKGLLQFSDARLLGRKLFVWGSGNGGRHWNEFLSEEGQAYIEIQAGLAHTQMEHIPMPAHTVWEWTEGYTALNCNADAIHGDWKTAVAAVRNELNSHEIHGEKLSDIKFPNDFKPYFSGDGWGALEQKIRAFTNGNALNTQIIFPEIIDEETAQWYGLLEGGILYHDNVIKSPESYVVGDFWIDEIKKSFERKGGRNWYSLLQLGVTLYADKDLKGAEQAWKASLELTPTLWSLRNLAMLYKNEYKDTKQGLEYMRRAAQMPDKPIEFHKEYGLMLIQSGNDEEWLKYYNSLTEEERKIERLLFYKAAALHNLGRNDKVLEILTPNFVLSDIKEGELSLSKLWFDAHADMIAERDGIDLSEASAKAKTEYPLPYNLDFRMH